MFSSARTSISFMAKLAMVIAAVITVGFSPAMAGKGGSFPKGPHLEMTPGELCKNPDSYRYPENIAYCERDVTTEEKRQIIADYDKEFGYTIRQMNRQDFKIDHLIPLCAGGSNSSKNLWPQHKSIYNLTDPLEQSICERMAQGELKQSEAIEIILEAKKDPTKVQDLWNMLESY